MLTWEDYNQDETAASAPEPAVIAAAAASQSVIEEPAAEAAEAAEAADAAELRPRASMIAAPRCWTVGMNVFSSHS